MVHNAKIELMKDFPDVREDELLKKIRESEAAEKQEEAPKPGEEEKAKEQNK